MRLLVRDPCAKEWESFQLANLSNLDVFETSRLRDNSHKQVSFWKKKIDRKLSWAFWLAASFL